MKSPQGISGLVSRRNLKTRNKRRSKPKSKKKHKRKKKERQENSATTHQGGWKLYDQLMTDTKSVGELLLPPTQLLNHESHHMEHQGPQWKI